MDMPPESDATPKRKEKIVRRDGRVTYPDEGFSSEEKDLCNYCLSTVFTMDMQRFVGRYPYTGAVLPGMIFAWLPSSPQACEIIEVVEVNDANALTRGYLRESSTPECWVDLETFRRSVVLSRCKTLPTSL